MLTEKQGEAIGLPLFHHMKKLLAVLGVLRVFGVLGIGVGVFRVLGVGGLVVLGVIHEIYLPFLYLRYEHSVTGDAENMQKNFERVKKKIDK